MTNHPKLSRSADSASGGTDKTMAKEIRSTPQRCTREDAVQWYGNYRDRLGTKYGYEVADMFQMLADFANEVPKP